MTTALAPDLADAVADFGTGALDSAEFTVLFGQRTVYAVRPPGRPRLAAYSLAGSIAPVFSSLAELARWCVGRAEPAFLLAGVDWYAMNGADLMSFWPEGVGLVVDPDSTHTVWHPAQCMQVDAAMPGRHPAFGGI